MGEENNLSLKSTPPRDRFLLTLTAADKQPKEMDEFENHFEQVQLTDSLSLGRVSAVSGGVSVALTGTSTTLSVSPSVSGYAGVSSGTLSSLTRALARSLARSLFTPSLPDYSEQTRLYAASLTAP